MFSFLKNNDLYEEYKEKYNELKYSAYRWNYNRIEDKCKKAFIKRWKQEFKDNKWPKTYGTKEEYYDKIALKLLPPSLYILR